MERRIFNSINTINFKKMKLTTQKYGEVTVRWQYNIKERKRDVTKAFLEKDKKVLLEVSVKKHPVDKYDKESARKYALTKLVQEAFSRSEDLSDRKEVWNAYQHRQ